MPSKPGFKMNKGVFFMIGLSIVFSARVAYSMGDDFALFWTNTVLSSVHLDLFGYCAAASCVCLVLFFFLGACIIRIDQLSKNLHEIKTEDHLIT